MKKPKITFKMWENGTDVSLDIVILLSGVTVNSTCHDSRKAAREWAKDWCRTVGAALMEKGK